MLLVYVRLLLYRIAVRADGLWVSSVSGILHAEAGHLLLGGWPAHPPARHNGLRHALPLRTDSALFSRDGVRKPHQRLRAGW